MKKKIISSLLIVALVLCVVPVAFPGVAAFAYSPDTSGYCLGCGSSEAAGCTCPSDEEEPNPDSWFQRLFVWVERGRDAEGQKDDRVKMEFTPVEEGDEAEYLEYYKDFTGWDDEPVYLYYPAENWLSVQAMGHLERFDADHYYGGKSSLEMGFIDSNYAVPEGPVYYRHEGFEDIGLEYDLMLRIGEYVIDIPAEYATSAFTFAARPDGSGGYEIILKDADGNDIEYTVVE